MNGAGIKILNQVQDDGVSHEDTKPLRMRASDRVAHRIRAPSAQPILPHIRAARIRTVRIDAAHLWVKSGALHRENEFKMSSFGRNVMDNLQEQKFINSVPTVTMFRDTSLTVDWATFRQDIVTAVVQFFSKDPIEGISSGISGLVKFASSVDVVNSPGELAWRLSARSFGWALDQVCQGKNVNPEDISSIINGALGNITDGGKYEEIQVPSNFLDRPTTLPLYQIFRTAVSNNPPYDIKSDSELNSFKYRLDASFDRAIFEIWSRKPSLYAAISQHLKIPGSVSAERTLNWSSYKKSVIYEFRVKPIFGQEDEGIALSQLYVPLRGYWPKETQEKTDSLDARHHPEKFDVVLIDEALDNWVNLAQPDDWLRLVGGGPGSGKSTTLKAFASRMSERDDWRTLFIPLQYINFESDLRDSINNFFAGKTDSSFTQPPLHRDAVEDGPPLILIFDGLDEIAAPGESANNIVSTFATRLNSLIGSLTGDRDRKIRVVVSGRMPAFQAAKRFLTPPQHGCLEAYGFLPFKKTQHSAECDSLWLVDQRTAWWQQYSALKGLASEIPPALRSEGLKDITHEPLLCYLLALAGYVTEHWEEAAENRNRIYSSLIGSVYDRVWGEGAIKRQGPGRSLSAGHFSKLMETIALAAWQAGDTRVASLAGFEKTIAITNAQDAWAAFTADNGQDVNNLAMNFYLKSAEKDQKGFEFTHKSFGEYLTSRALIEIARDISVNSRRKIEHALADWLEATSGGVITEEILQFMRDELRLQLAKNGSESKIDEIVKLKEAYQLMNDKVEEDGFPHCNISSTWKVANNERMQSHVAIWAIINSCSHAISDYDYDKSLVILKFNNPFGLNNLLQNLGSVVHNTIINMCFSYIYIRDQYLFSIDGYNFNFEGANFESSIFINCSFSNSSFKNAALNQCRFLNCNFTDTIFDGLKSSGIFLNFCQLRNLSLQSIDVDMIVLNHETVFRSDIDIITQIMKVVKFDLNQYNAENRRKDCEKRMQMINEFPVYTPDSL